MHAALLIFAALFCCAADADAHADVDADLLMLMLMLMRWMLIHYFHADISLMRHFLSFFNAALMLLPCLVDADADADADIFSLMPLFAFFRLMLMPCFLRFFSLCFSLMLLPLAAYCLLMLMPFSLLPRCQQQICRHYFAA